MRIKIGNDSVSYMGWAKQSETQVSAPAELDQGNQTDFERWWFNKINGAYVSLQPFLIPFLPL